MTLNNTLNRDFCITNGSDIVTFPLNRSLKYLGVILCSTSILPLLYVQHKYIHKTTFHFNIKIILIFYFANATFHASLLTFFTTAQLHVSYSDLTDPCNVFLSRQFYLTGHLLNFYALFFQGHLQVVACLERIIATARSQNYEHNGKLLGIVLVILALISPVAFGFWAYWDESFDQPQISVLTTPQSSNAKVNCLFIYCIVLCIGGLISLQVTTLINQRRKKQLRFSLSSHYQCKENISTTRFISAILILQMIVYLFFGLGTLLLRLLRDSFDTDDMVLYLTLKTSMFLLPVFLFCLPFLSGFLLKRVRRLQKEQSRSLVRMASRGKEGTSNYEDIIYSRWK